MWNIVNGAKQNGKLKGNQKDQRENRENNGPGKLI